MNKMASEREMTDTPFQSLVNLYASGLVVLLVNTTKLREGNAKIEKTVTEVVFIGRYGK